jgi:uncharacterized SAM-binding protein YcdF (DUF218 family)
MFFILSKLLLFLISPFFWFIVSLLLIFYFKNPTWKKRAKISAIFIFIFFTNTAILGTFLKQWETPGTRISDVKSHDVGIVLSGMAEYDNHLQRLSVRRGTDRLWQAITLYKKGKIKKLFISGGSGYVSDRGLKESLQFKDVLVQWGIPKEDILIETKSRNTFENAVETKKELKKLPTLNSYLLITSGTHMKRAQACFAKQNIQCTPFSTDLYTAPNGGYYWDQYIIPNVSNFDVWNVLIKEWVGYVTYSMKGYL